MPLHIRATPMLCAMRSSKNSKFKIQKAKLAKTLFSTHSVAPATFSRAAPRHRVRFICKKSKTNSPHTSINSFFINQPNNKTL